MRVEQLRQLWTDRLMVLDPGLEQFRRAWRATLAAGGAAAFLFQLTGQLHEPTTIAFIGVYVAMLSSILVTDAAPAQQRVTLLLVAAAAAVAIALGTVVGSSRWLNGLVFLTIIFGAVWIREFGPRWNAVGLGSFLSYFIALFFRARITDLPWLGAGIFIGTLAAFATRFWLVPDNPSATLRQGYEAYRAQIRILFRRLERVLERADWSTSEGQRFHGMVATLNELALWLEDQDANLRLPDQSVPPAAFRLWVFEMELAVETVLESVRHLIPEQAGSTGLRQLLQAAVRSARCALQDCGGGAPSLAMMLHAVSTGQHDPAVRGSLARFLRGLREFQRLASGPAGSASAGALAEVVHATTPAVPSAERARRQAVQATVAGALAMLAGQAISQDRWYWAVIAAFVVFVRATSRGEMLLRAWQRVLGTAVGLVLGFVVADLMSGHRRVEIGLVFACLFLAYWSVRISYAWMILWFSILLAILYNLLGRLTPELLSLRLLETLVGAGIGAASAAIVLPVPTAQRVKSSAVDVLAGVHDALAEMFAPSASAAGTSQATVRQLDRKFQLMRTSAEVLRGRFVPAHHQRPLRLVQSISALVFFVRNLIHSLSGEAPSPELTVAGLQFAAEAQILSAALRTNQPAKLKSFRAEFKSLRQSVTQVTDAWHWLQRIDQELLKIADLLHDHSQSFA